MKAEVVHIRGLTFMGRADIQGSWVPIDHTEEAGGSNGGSTPKELLLMAIGGCTGMDIESILKKMQVEFDSFKIDVEGESAETHPKIFTKIKMTYVFEGRDIDRAKVEKAINLSIERYCPINAMIKNATEVVTELIIEEASN